ncbi:hypothetical protein BDN70DRAFT_526087 [Pholiota conissans]|uniref:DUF7223 domain-containing protein n=1 Tax=Pholiota conissans TaxID=109636 RepID=A0A9P6CMK4_9AGAR|nr:hypothetical protein BDN70DRAFT_526087 [Pholiota conissans]
MIYRSLFVLSVLTTLAVVSADNDWSKPCLSGVCQYDLPPSSAGSATGTLKIWGAKDAIGDITVAGGWEILDCSPDELDQDIRLVCKDTSAQEDCSQLFTAGAEGKIVRLPENCGQNAFALITKSWVPEDQSVPSHISARFTRRGDTPQVRALTLATKFDSVDMAKKTTGDVNFAIQAANVPGASGDLDVSTVVNERRMNSRIYRRGLFSFVKKAVQAIASLDNFNVDKSVDLPPLDVDKPFTLVDQSIDCPPIAAKLTIDVDAKAHAVASIGVAASGTILPPKVNDFAIITNLKAEINGTVDLAAALSGSLDSGKVEIFSVGLPGLDFPGILTLGPSFKVDAQAKALLDVNVDMSVGLNYKIDNAQLVFPPSAKEASKGAFNIGDTPLTLSASSGVNATGTLEAHLIPSLNLGLQALGGTVDASVFLELDASASLILGLEALAEANGDVTPRDRVIDIEERHHRSHRISSHKVLVAQHMATVNQTSTMTAASASETASTSMATNTSTSLSASRSTDASSSSAAATSTTIMASSTVSTSSEASTATPTATNSTIDTNTKLGGCFEIDAGLDVNAGANADFFGLFNKDTSVSLFSKKFQVVKKCFGDSTDLPEVSPVVAGSAGTLDNLLCPAADTPAAVAIAEQTIPSAEIKQL